MACQIKMIPEEMQSGLSEEVEKAVPLMAQWIVKEYF
jgi:Ni,Fe-hydrogenase maturation factor